MAEVKIEHHLNVVSLLSTTAVKMLAAGSFITSQCGIDVPVLSFMVKILVWFRK